MGGNHRNLAHQSPLGNMHKLFASIQTPLKPFLACLTFHRKEKQLHHLHQRTNPGSAPGNNRKFRKPHFSGKLVNEVLFSWA